MKTSHPFAAAILSLLLAATPHARAQIASESWVARYNSPENGNDSSTGVVVDGTGNVIVTGWTSIGGGAPTYYQTAKYAAGNGDLVWEKRYDGPLALARDFARSVAVDSAGNVAVTGITDRTSNYSSGDIYTAKYASADGALLWYNRYNGPDNHWDEGMVVVVDQSGNVIVTGLSFNADNADCYTAKYASVDGALLWEKRYNGPGNGDDHSNAIALDNSGNVVITGFSEGSGTGRDYYTAKYGAADGAILWEKRYSHPSNSIDFATSVAVDNAGNVVVAGVSYSATAADLHTIKYAAADGALLWEKRHIRPAVSVNLGHQPVRVAVDSAGNVALTGVSDAAGGNGGYYTARYAAADGELLWEKFYEGPGNGPDLPSAVTVDATGNAIVTGQSWNGTDYELYTASYAVADGHLLWEAHYNSPGNAHDHASDGPLALSPDGGVIITGSTGPAASLDRVTVKLVPPVVTPYDLRTGWQDGAILGSPGNFGPWSLREGSNVLTWQGILPGIGTNLGYAPGNAVGNFLPCGFQVIDALASDLQIGDVALHSTDPLDGGGNGIANVIWTSTGPGYASVTGHIWQADTSPGRENTWRIYKNDLLLTTGVISDADAYSRAAPFVFGTGSGDIGVLQGILVTAGDVLRLEVERTNSVAGSLVGVELTVAHTESVTPPHVVTGAVTDIGLDTATLRATVNPNGGATTVSFREGGNSLGSVNLPAGSSPVPVSLAVTFPAGTAHTIHAHASNRAGSIAGNDVGFSLLGGPPIVTAGPVTNLTPNSATLHATVNPNGIASTVHFYSYDLEMTFGSVPIPAGFEPVVVDLPISGLESGSVYTVDVTVVNPSHVVSAGPLIFLTPISIAQWKLGHLGDANAPDLDDPDHDGLSILLEYGLSLAPNAPDTPMLGETTFAYPEGMRLRFLIPRDPVRADVNLFAEAASSLEGPWTTVASSLLGTPFSGPGYVGGDEATPGLKSVEVRDTVNVADEASRYMRVRVTR